jgi:predicted transposase/invertase (TIGR01784 family)
MKSDSLFFRLFKESPNCFFHLIGRPENDAQQYDLDSIEYKSTAVRLDGVFQPRRSDVDPAYIWEAQTYPSDKVYANLLTKIGRFLEHGNPKQDWVAVVIYSNRSVEQKNLRPYRCLIDSDQLVRIYLDELPPAPPDNFDLGALQLIAAEPEAALEKAKELVPRVRQSKRSHRYRQMVIQFIETVIVHQFPHLSREEIENMLKVNDVRQTRVFQEAKEEGKKEGKEEGIEEGLEKSLAALRLLMLNRPIAEIAETTGLTVAQVRKLKKNQPQA